MRTLDSDTLIDNLSMSTVEVMIRHANGEFDECSDPALALANAIDNAAFETTLTEDRSAPTEQLDRIFASIPNQPSVCKATDQVVPVCAPLTLHHASGHPQSPPASTRTPMQDHWGPPTKCPRFTTSKDATDHRHRTTRVVTAPPKVPTGHAGWCVTHGQDFVHALTSERTAQRHLDAMLPASSDFLVRCAWDSERPHDAFQNFCSCLQENDCDHHCAAAFAPARHFTPPKRGSGVFAKDINVKTRSSQKDRVLLRHVSAQFSSVQFKSLRTTPMRAHPRSCMADANLTRTSRGAHNAPMAISRDSGSNVTATPHLSHLVDLKWHPVPKRTGLATSDTTTILAEGTATIHSSDTNGEWHPHAMQMSCVPEFPEPIPSKVKFKRDLELMHDVAGNHVAGNSTVPVHIRNDQEHVVCKFDLHAPDASRSAKPVTWQSSPTVTQRVMRDGRIASPKLGGWASSRFLKHPRSFEGEDDQQLQNVHDLTLSKEG